jgi:hypothetical protein
MAWEQIWTCPELSFTISNVTRFATDYPICQTFPNGLAIVPAHIRADSLIENIGSALRVSFGMGLWAALFIHVIGVEIYVSSFIFILASIIIVLLFTALFGVKDWWRLIMRVEQLHLTTAETERLRMISYERQMERGWKNAGSAGLVSERWGDAKV